MITSSKLISRLFIFGFAALLAFSKTAFASYLTILATTTATASEESKTVSIHFSVQNDGDENAKEVGISLPTVNQSRMLSADMPPKGTATADLTFTFEELGIKLGGTYIIPFHTTYKDANLFPFSSPQTISVVLPPSPSKSVMVKFDSLESSQSLELAHEGSVDATIINVGTAAVEVSQVLAFSASELLANTNDLTLPVTLQPQEEKKLRLTFKNTGALIGSGYASRVIVSGVSAGRHFSESFNFVISIVSDKVNPQIVFKWIAISLAILSIVFWATKSLFLRTKTA